VFDADRVPSRPGRQSFDVIERDAGVLAASELNDSEDEHHQDGQDERELDHDRALLSLS
jgi:hypothetical protein